MRVSYGFCLFSPPVTFWRLFTLAAFFPFAAATRLSFYRMALAIWLGCFFGKPAMQLMQLIRGKMQRIKLNFFLAISYSVASCAEREFASQFRFLLVFFVAAGTITLSRYF